MANIKAQDSLWPGSGWAAGSVVRLGLPERKGIDTSRGTSRTLRAWVLLAVAWFSGFFRPDPFLSVQIN